VADAEVARLIADVSRRPAIEIGRILSAHPSC
jgi:hypothetical protein